MFKCRFLSCHATNRVFLHSLSASIHLCFAHFFLAFILTFAHTNCMLSFTVIADATTYTIWNGKRNRIRFDILWIWLRLRRYEMSLEIYYTRTQKWRARETVDHICRGTLFIPHPVCTIVPLCNIVINWWTSTLNTPHGTTIIHFISMFV